jgi:HEAT repeat protein
MRVMPVVLGLGTLFLLAGAAVLPELMVGTALGLKVGESGLRYSLEQSTRELLFLPVASSLRVKAKAFIDVFVQRMAKGFGALLLLPVTFGLMTAVQSGWIALGLSILWLVAAGAAYRAYVKSFRAGLKHRSVDAVIPIDLADVKTVELLVQSLGSTDARQVLHSLAILESNGRGNLVPPLLLYHDDAEVRRRTLQVLAGMDRRDAAPLVERRLADDDPEVRAEAIRVLTEFSAGDACELMLPRLQESDPRVRAAAITCLINHGDDDTVAVARRALTDMLSDAASDQRAEGVKAIGAIHDPELEGRLLESLYDREPSVAREAILAVQRIVKRDGFSPLYAPRLISLLQDRRLKHDAREALLAFGEDSIPILVHFMNDPGESIWVRRALPKALARIGGAITVSALLDSLPRAEDAVLRSQIVEALATRREELAAIEIGVKMEQAIQDETVRYFERLTDVAALGQDQEFRFEAPLVRWDTRELNLLTQMVAERIEEHVKTVFGMLALILPARDVWAAYRSLLSGQSGMRSHALEYLDNTLGGEIRKNVFAIIDDASLPAKLELAARRYDVPQVSLTASVRRFLHADGEGAPDGPALTVAALYSVYTDGMTELYSEAAHVAEENPNPLVQETASWIATRLDSGG